MRSLVPAFLFLIIIDVSGQKKHLVLQSDFGVKDGAVAAMKGVAVSVSDDIGIYDLTHEIPAYNIWEAACRLNQAASYWPKGTVFVSVVDPGVGSSRRSVVMKSRTGHYFVTPDNGTLTLVAETMGVEELRLIDEHTNRLKGSAGSYTFHGRDVYAFTGARLAAGIITFEQVGPRISADVVRLPYQKPQLVNGVIKGTIEILDIQYGNLWTNIGQKWLDEAGVKAGDTVAVTIVHEDLVMYEAAMIYGRTFSDVPESMPIAYLNSLLNFSVALNMGNFSERYQIGSGPAWRILVRRK